MTLRPSQERVFVDDTTRDIIRKERVHRSRTAVLQSSGKVGQEGGGGMREYQVVFFSVTSYSACTAEFGSV